MATAPSTTKDLESLAAQLADDGYVVIENVIPDDELAELKATTDELFATNLESPYDPGDGPSHPQDAELEAYITEMYPTVEQGEIDRVMRINRYHRHHNADTPWPVPPEDVPKNFVYLPDIFEGGTLQFVGNLPARSPIYGPLIEHPTVLALTRSILGEDCVLSDTSATSLGPGTKGGAWHVDAPLGQFPEPLPEFPITTQNAWMLDDFTVENGATRVAPGSHKLRKKPPWGMGELEGEISLTAPAGSVAIWLSNTWHRASPNSTSKPRPAILCYYTRSWCKPYANYPAGMSDEQAKGFSETARYLLGYSAGPVVRGS